MGGDGGVVQMRWWWQWGIAFTNGRQENNLRAKNLKSSHRGLISGALSEMGMNVGGVRQCGGMDEVVVVVVGRGVRKCKAGEGAEGQKWEIEPLGLDFGCAVGSGAGEQWEEVQQLCR